MAKGTSVQSAKEAAVKATDKAAENTVVLASVGVAAAGTVESLLPTAAETVERASHNLAGHFSALAQNIAIQGKLIKTLLEHLPATNLTATEREELEALAQTTSEKLSAAVSGVIVDMQFQDRNTQVMQSAAHILQRYSTMLEEVHSHIKKAKDTGHTTSIDISEGIDTILSGLHIHEIVARAIEATLAGIRIHEIRQQFVESLHKAKVPYTVDAGAAAPADGENSVELF